MADGDKGLEFAENFARACIALRKAVDAGEGLTLNAAESKALMNGMKALSRRDHKEVSDAE